MSEIMADLEFYGKVIMVTVVSLASFLLLV